MRRLKVVSVVLSAFLVGTELKAQSPNFPQPALFEGADDGTQWADFAQPENSEVTPIFFQQTQPGTASPNATNQFGAGGQANPGLNLGPQPAPGRQNPFANNQRATSRQQYLSRLNRAPDLFGDSFIPQTLALNLDHLDNSSTSQGLPDTGTLEANVPIGGGTRRFKNEQARALPTDRVFFYFNHFHNAVEVKQLSNVNRSASANVDQFTLGAEKTFGEGNWSVEVRMPFAGSTDIGIPGFRYQSDGVGNLTATLKRLIYSDENTALAMGLAVTTPTGSDADATIPVEVPDVGIGNVRIHTENQAVHLLPYAALQYTPDDNWFFHGFAQVDVAANDNTVNITGARGNSSGTFREQTLLYLDASAGYWWYRSDDDESLTGLATVLELHYTTSLDDSNTRIIGSGDFLSIGNSRNRIDVVNLTCGVHTEWWHHTSLRGALVVPLGGEADRFFDSEIQLSLVRRF